MERQGREKDVKYREKRKEFEKDMRDQFFSETLTLRNVGAKNRGKQYYVNTNFLVVILIFNFRLFS